MGKYITIDSVTQLDEVLKSTRFVLVDFWATWCPPCKAIAPLFEKHADESTKEGGLAFVKVDVDAQQEIAQRYNITAMPTFLLIENGEVINSLKGANPQGIKTFVTHAVQGLEKDGAAATGESKTEQPATLGTAV